MGIGFIREQPNAASPLSDAPRGVDYSFHHSLLMNYGRGCSPGRCGLGPSVNLGQG